MGLFPGMSHFLYVEMIGDLKDLSGKIGNFFKVLYENPDFIKQPYYYRMWGLYYDNPRNLKDTTKYRSIWGLQLEEQVSQETIDKIIAADKQGMKHAVLPMG